MKKILLIIAITLCIFQMVVLATVIDIGSTVVDRNNSMGVYTVISKTGAASGTGKITSIQIYAYASMTSCKVATFFVVSGNNLTARDVVTLGAVTSGGVRTFTEDFESNPISLDVVTGDYIGLYYGDGQVEAGAPYTDGIWYVAGDQTACENQTFTYYATWDASIAGIGATEEEAANAIFFGTNF